MVVRGLKIALDNPSRQYSSGQNISGKVLCNVVGDEAVTEIFIRFFGFACTQWKEVEVHHHTRERRDAFYSMHDSFHERSRHTHTEHYTTTEDVFYQANEPYFNIAVRLLGNGVTISRIPAGDNTFPFVFQVPTKPLPLNCAFEDGKVQYGLEAQIMKANNQYPVKTDAIPVTLVPVVDLNAYAAAVNKPIQLGDNQQIGCCCNAKPCLLQSFTPRQGFVAGEEIPCVIQMDNTSNEQITCLTAAFTQVWTFFSDNPSRGRHSRQKPLALQALGHQGVGPGQKITWEAKFKVPPAVPPTLDSNASRLVKLEYVININAPVDASCGVKNLALAHPVFVGTIPLKSPPPATAQLPKYDEKGGLA